MDSARPSSATGLRLSAGMHWRAACAPRQQNQRPSPQGRACKGACVEVCECVRYSKRLSACKCLNSKTPTATTGSRIMGHPCHDASQPLNDQLVGNSHLGQLKGRTHHTCAFLPVVLPIGGTQTGAYVAGLESACVFECPRVRDRCLRFSARNRRR